MANTFKNIREAISSSQLKRLKKEYEHMRNIDMSKHKGQVKKVTAVISKLKIGTLIDLYKENIPWISDIAKSLVLKDKRFAHHVEEVQEADLSKSQVKMVHKKADELPKHDFIKRYGADGDAVRYATATNIVKKKLGITEAIKMNQRAHEIRELEFTFSNEQQAKKAEDWIEKSDWTSFTGGIQDIEQHKNTVWMGGITDPGGLEKGLKQSGFKFKVTHVDNRDTVG